MATEYCLSCEYCHKTTDDYRRHKIETALAEWPHVREIWEKSQEGIVSVVSFDGYYFLLDFLSEHDGHGLNIVDEYGNSEPIV